MTATEAVHDDEARRTIRLLLADDHPMLRQGLRRSLEEEGFEVVGEAGDGAAAVELVSALRPDVALLDVSMPRLDGIEACRRIRASTPGTQVVMLTMHADADIVGAALAAGAAGYLVKDSEVRDVAEAVRLAASDEPLSPSVARSMLAEARRPGLPGEPSPITRREEEVLQLIADGCSTPEVAAKLYISQKTVKNHLASIYEKLDARDRTQAVLAAVRLGIVRLR